MSNLIFTLDVQKAWYISLFRSLFAFLDWVVYFIIELLFRAIFNIANFELYGLYEEIQERVFVVLGIFMLFKVTISLITYLVNPDKISDKEQGVSKVVTRIITVLVMLIALPTFFSLMTEAQNKLLPVIPRVIIGTANTLSSDDVNGISENMALTMIQGFAHKKEDCDGDALQSVDDFLAHINDSCSEGNDTYKYDYLPIISTITGVLMCYVLFSLCISVAIRAFKLIILRSIAPIPIVSYIDPKSSKDGAFSTWVKTFFSTWGELFIHIGLIYFIVYIIDFMISRKAYEGLTGGLIDGPMGFVDGVFMFAFLIIGLLFFAKQAPKFVMDTLGIKTKGNFVRMLGMGATALGMGGTMASSLKARRKYNVDNPLDSTGNAFKDKARNALRSAGAVGGSLFSGLASGATAGGAILSSDKPSLMTGYDAQQNYNARNLSRVSAGSTFLGRMSARTQMLLGGETKYDAMNRELASNKEANSAIGAWLSGAKSKALDADDHGKKGILVDVAGHNGLNYKTLNKNIEAAQNGDEAAMQYLIDKGFTKTINVEEKFYETEKVQVGTKWVWTDDGSEQVEVPVYEDRQVEKTKTVQKQVADWQAAYAILTEVEDKQVNEHMFRIASETYTDIDGNVQKGGNDYDGANYDKYERATYAMKGLTGKDASGNEFNIEFNVGKADNELLKSSKAMAGATTDNQRRIEQHPDFESAKVDAKEAKKP